MRLALQIKDYSQHWFLRAAIIALLASFVGSFPSSGAANEDHFSCLNGAIDDKAALSVCIEKMDKRCILVGDDLFDYPPQAACFKGYSDAILEVAKDLRDKLARDPTVIGVRLKDAALRRSIRIGEADCDFHDETFRHLSDDLPGRKERAKAACYANMRSLAYWIVIVNNRLR